MINGRLVLFPVSNMMIDNMFVIHNCWENRRMGINIWLNRDIVTKPNGPNRLNRQCLLHSKMLKYDGWEILDLVWEDFLNLGNQVARDKFLHEWFHSTSIKQEKKGIFEINPKFV